jgi:hypothetical protein
VRTCRGPAMREQANIDHIAIARSGVWVIGLEALPKQWWSSYAFVDT